jgi:hypothetical protein
VVPASARRIPTVSNKVEQDPTLLGPIDASVKAKQADQQLQLKAW